MSEIIIKTENAVIRQQRNTILKNVNLEIQSGEFVYLIGKVGSGKSSFLKTLYAELPLEYGKVEVAGHQLKKIKKSHIPLLRRKCGIVFQDFKLLTDRNVYANLEFVLKATGWKNKKAIQERIDLVLQKVEMQDKREKMPHELSGGEQQRIVLARALLNAPPLILADEPTGNIDPETSYRLIELLKDICETGKTIIIATHQYDLIEKYPGRVLKCENGTLIEDENLSVRPHTLSPEAIESIEDIPLTDEALPDVIESDIQTPFPATIPAPTASGPSENGPETDQTPFIPEKEEKTQPEEMVSAPEADVQFSETALQSIEAAEPIENEEEIITPPALEPAEEEEEKTEDEDDKQETPASSAFGFELID